MAADAIELTVPGPHGDRVVRISSPTRVIWPEAGITKRELAEYLVAVGDAFVTANGDRPISLQRFPGGVDGEQFFSKNPPKGAPEWVRSVPVTYPSGRSHPQLVIDEPATAVWAAQMNTIVFHPWASRAGNSDNPDQLRIDLDPQPGTGFAEAVPVALALRELLAEVDLTAYREDVGQPRHPRLRADRGRTRVPRRAARGDRARARARATHARRGHHEVVEGGARRPHLHRLQPGEPRSYDGGRLQPSPAAGRHGVVPDRVGRDRDDRPRQHTIRTVPARLADHGDPWATMHDQPGRIDTLLEWWQRDLDDGLGELPFPPDFPKMPGEPIRVQPSRAKKD